MPNKHFFSVSNFVNVTLDMYTVFQSLRLVPHYTSKYAKAGFRYWNLLMGLPDNNIPIRQQYCLCLLYGSQLFVRCNVLHMCLYHHINHHCTTEQKQRKYHLQRKSTTTIWNILAFEQHDLEFLDMISWEHHVLWTHQYFFFFYLLKVKPMSNYMKMKFRYF